MKIFSKIMSSSDSTSLSQGLIKALILLALIANFIPMLRSSRRAWRDYVAMAPKSLEECRLAIYGPLYKDVNRATALIPIGATIWLVAPEMPWHQAYFLYPRTIRWGAPNYSAIPELRQRHPRDWVLAWKPTSHHGSEMFIFAPLTKASCP